MSLRPAIAAIALMLAFLGALPSAYAAGAFAFDGLPGISEGQRLEAVILIDDLREMRGKMQRQRGFLERTAFGKAYVSPENQRALLGLDLYGELDRLLGLVAPKGSKVPVVAAVVSDAQAVHVQLALKVEDGALDRLAAAKGEAYVTFTNDNGALKVTAHGVTMPAKVDGGWLRVGPTDADLALAGNPAMTALPDAVARWAKDSQMVIALLGGGTFSASLAKLVGDNPMVQDMVANARALAVTFRLDDDLSQVMRVVFDSDTIKQLSPMMRSPSATSAAAAWDAHALSAASLAVPPMLLTGALTLAQLQMPQIADPSVQELVKAAQSLDGRLSIATFGAPGDWAAAADFSDETSAQRFVTVGYQALQTILERYAVEPGLVRYESKEGAEALKLRPDVTLSDTTVRAIGKSVVVARQRMRAERLASLRKTGSKTKSLLDGPLTPAIREVLARPAILQGYSVAGYDGTTIEWFYWPAKLLEVGAKQMRELLPKNALDGDLYGAALANPASLMMARLPLSLATAGFSLASVYDYAVALDVDDSAVVLQLAGSQL